MTTWGCNCDADPVGDSAKGVLTAILQRKPIAEQHAELLSAQKALVERVCQSCWPKGPDQIYWVNAYVEPEQKLHENLEGTLAGHSSTDWFLYGPAGFNLLNDNAVGVFHKSILFKALEAVPDRDRQSQWLSNIFAKPNSPPIVRISRQHEQLNSSPPLYVHPLYGCLFDGRNDAVYIHAAYPCRNTDLGAHVGPAGAYLFLKDTNAEREMPPCLIFHLRAFVQALVTAQLWTLSQHMMEDLKTVAEPFALHHGHLRLFLNAATEITKRVDPLHLDTSEIYDLKNAASPIFEAKANDTERFHSFRQVKALDNAGRTELGRLLEAFLAKVNASSDLGLRLREAFTQHTGIEERWVLARACYKSTISLYLLTSQSSHVYLALSPHSELLTAAREEDRTRQRLNVERHLAVAALQLVTWKRDSYAFEYSGGRLVIKGGAACSAVLQPAVEYVDSSRARPDGGGDSARMLARILRGMAGTDWASLRDQIRATNESVSIEIEMADFRT